MFLNPKRGSCGAFSTAGKTSAQSNYLILRNKDILDNKNKTKNTRDVIIQFLRRNNYENIYYEVKQNEIEEEKRELEENQIETIADNIKLFEITDQPYEATTKINKKRNQQWKPEEKKKINHRDNAENYKYHDMHMQAEKVPKEDKHPGPNKYNPKYNLTKPRLIIGPEWGLSKTKRVEYKADENSKFYVFQGDPLANINKDFFHFDKQSSRGNFITGKNGKCYQPTESSVRTRPISCPGTRKKSEKYNKSYNKSSSKGSKNNVLTEDNQEEEEEEMFELQMNNAKNLKESKFNKRPFSMRPKTGFTKASTRPVTTTGEGLNTNEEDGIIDQPIEEDESKDQELIQQEEDEKNDEVVNENVDGQDDDSSLNDSYELYKNNFTKQLKKKPKVRPATATFAPTISKMERSNVKTLTNGNVKTTDIKNRIVSAKEPTKRKMKLGTNKVRGPDFNKMISREYLNSLNDNSSVIPFSLPNFSQVRERALTMAVYDRRRHNKKKRKPEIQGIEPSMFYDKDAVLGKINNHVEVNPPNFKMMFGRPESKDKNDIFNKLPYFMKRVHSKIGSYAVTEDTLKMNNYSDSKFLTNYTSFWPKKSFNKMVNLNILNSENFLSNAFGDKNQITQKNDYVGKSMKFYNKNYNDLMKESILSNFDNVTYKTIPKLHKINQKELDKFILNYNQANRKNVEFNESTEKN